MRDREILLIVTSVILTLIFSNLSLFLKSFSSTPFASPEIKQAARQIETDAFRKSEQDFWSKIKDIDFAPITPKPEKSQLEAAPKVPQQVTKTTVAVKPKLTKPYRRFLFVGDSIMFDLGVHLQYTMKQKYKIADTKLEYKVSSGLNRIDYYNWYARTKELLDDYQPDVVVILFGGNDPQDITDFQGKYRAIATPEWQQAYQQRVDKYAKLLASSSVRKVYWIGQPISPKFWYAKHFPVMNEVYKNASKSSAKIEFISTWDTFAASGKFAPVVADKSGKRGYVKINDGVHFTSHGAKIIGDLIADKMVADRVLNFPKPPVSPKKKS